MALARKVRPVIEHMPQMPAAPAAIDFHARMTKKMICAGLHRLGKRSPEAGPARSAFEFCTGRKQGSTAPRTEEYTLTMFLVKRTGEGAFSRRFTQHRILPGREALFPFSIGEIDFESSEELKSELQSLMRISYAVFCLT